jgi:hypothetical protein
VVDLVDFLRRAELGALQIGPAVVEVDLPQELDAREAELEVNMKLRVWRLLHPAVTVSRLSAPA